MNTIKTTVIADQHRNVLWTGAIVPGRMHDQTAVKCHGIDALIEFFPDVSVLVDAGYRGLGKAHLRTGDRSAAQAGQGQTPLVSGSPSMNWPGTSNPAPGYRSSNRSLF